jgi:hypothetical protein
MERKQQTPESRRLQNTRKNSLKAEQYLSRVEREHGAAEAWELRERLERGQVTLKELKGSSFGH